MLELEEIRKSLEANQRGIERIIASNNSLERVIQDKLDTHTKDIDTLYNARNDIKASVIELETKVYIFDKQREEYRLDLKEARAEIIAIQERILAKVDLSFSMKNETCQKTHNAVDAQITEAQFQMAKDLSSYKKQIDEKLNTVNANGEKQNLSTRNWILFGVSSVLTAMAGALLSKVIFK